MVNESTALIRCRTLKSGLLNPAAQDSAGFGKKMGRLTPLKIDPILVLLNNENDSIEVSAKVSVIGRLWTARGGEWVGERDGDDDDDDYLAFAMRFASRCVPSWR